MPRRRRKMGILVSDKFRIMSIKALRIADDYVRNCEEYENIRDNKFGTLKTTRIQVPPYLRPIAVLKRDIYTFCTNVYRSGEIDYLQEMYHLRQRQAAKRADRLRDPTIVDLAIRVIRWARLPKGKGQSYEPLFSTSIQKQMVTELNFAFGHRIDPHLCTAFITELGGHEIIGAMVSTQKSELQPGWLRGMQNTSRFIVHHRPTAQYGIRQLRVMHTSNADALRHQEEEEDLWEEDGWEKKNEPRQ
jgi:hypothetical protein